MFPLFRILTPEKGAYIFFAPFAGAFVRITSKIYIDTARLILITDEKIWV